MSTVHDPRYLEVITRLRNARRSQGNSQRELAQTLGKTQSWVSKVESGERRLDIIETLDMCAVLGISLNDLIASIAKSPVD